MYDKLVIAIKNSICTKHDLSNHTYTCVSPLFYYTNIIEAQCLLIYPKGQCHYDNQTPYYHLSSLFFEPFQCTMFHKKHLFLYFKEHIFLAVRSVGGIELLSNNTPQSDPIPKPIKTPFCGAFPSHLK